MHNAAFRELKVNAEYRLFPLRVEQLDEFFNDLRRMDSPIFGLNVTVPYKEKVIPFLDNLAPFALKARAVNTIVISKERQLKGYNTDGPGFLAHLADLGVSTQGTRVAIMGAGGASRAIISVLCLIPQRPESIRIYDIEHHKAQQLLDDLAEQIDVSIVKAVPSIEDLNVELSDLLINATPIGLKESDPFLFDPELLHAHLMVYDLIYNPAETPLLKIAREKGGRTANGLGMLFYQGVLAFQHWADMELDEKVKKRMWTSLEKGMNDD